MPVTHTAYSKHYSLYKIYTRKSPKCSLIFILILFLTLCIFSVASTEGHISSHPFVHNESTWASSPPSTSGTHCLNFSEMLIQCQSFLCYWLPQLCSLLTLLYAFWLFPTWLSHFLVANNPSLLDFICVFWFYIFIVHVSAPHSINDRSLVCFYLFYSYSIKSNLTSLLFFAHYRFSSCICIRWFIRFHYWS